MLSSSFSICVVGGDAQFLVEDVPTTASQLRPVMSFDGAVHTHSNFSSSNRSGQVTCATGYQPVIVFFLKTQEIDTSLLRQKISDFQKDTELLPHFWSHIVLAIPGQELQLPFSVPEDAETVFAGLCCSQLSILPLPDSEATIPEGPYFATDHSVYRTWRLFPDEYEAFQLPVFQLSPTTFVGITIMHNGKVMVPVPSRLHAPKSDDNKPLNGLRFTVKDVIDVEGVPTTAQSRAYDITYGKATATAPTVQKLVGLGAVVLGKTKCTQFASSDQPTADWVDYHCPWNPRGDTYQNPRGSSTGPAVAVAGYDWVDFGLGTDTGGSIRGPSSVMGAFAIRPSLSASDMTNIIPIAKSLDTTGIVCRSSEHLRSITASLYGRGESTAKKPLQLLYPEEFWNQWPDDAAQAARRNFVAAFEQFLGQPASKLSLAEVWKQAKLSPDSLEDYLKTPFMTLLWKGYHDSLQPFFNKHKAQFGHPPYLHPTVRYCYDRGSTIRQLGFEDALQRQKVYTSWMRTSVMQSDSSNTVMVYPCGNDAPYYRDAYRKPPNEMAEYSWWDREDHQASLAGMPAVVIPVGQVPYPSQVTGETQLLPVCVQLMGSAGTDYALMNLVHGFLDSVDFPGIQVGTHAFPAHVTPGDMWNPRV